MSKEQAGIPIGSIGSPKVVKIVESGVNKEDYHQFLLDSLAAARAGYPPELYSQPADSFEGEVVDNMEEK